MIKNLRYLCTLLLIAVASAAWGQKVTLDFTTQDWNLPTSSQVMNGNTYSSGDYTITFNSGNAYQATQTSGDVKTYYLLMGKSGASMSLPAFNFKVSKIVVTGRTGASASVKQNFYVGDDAVSTETTGATGVNTYEINESYRDIGTVYTLKVTSAHNTQITKIDIYEDDGSVVELSDPELSFTPTSVDAVYGEPFTVPTLSTAEGFDGSITYSSSDPSVATVKNSGEVTLVGAGETTITATSAPTKTFKSGTASYTLTVTVNEETEGVTYIKVTADDQVVVGKRFILVNEEKNVANTLLGSNTYLGNVAITITDSKIVTEKAAPITLGRTSTGYSLKTSEGYINSVAAKKLSNSEEEVAIWNIVSTDDGYVVRGVDAETLGTIQYNASSPRFLNYTTTQKPAVLYVESDGSDTPVVTVPAPTFNPVAGEVEAGTAVEIICPDEADGVEYSFDQSNWTEYKTPIEITDATTIYARAYDADGNYSDVVSAAYTIKQDVPGPGEYETVAVPYTVDFTQGQDKFVVEDVANDLGVEIWTQGSSYGMTATSYVQLEGEEKKSNHDGESWLVSPIIDLSEHTAASLAVTDQVNKFFGDYTQELGIFVREENGNWNKLDVTYSKPSSTWGGWEDRVVDLTSYVGKKVQIGFYYKGTETSAGTYELKNFSVTTEEPVIKKDAELSYSVSTFTATIGEDVEFPVLNNPNELEGITYSSSREDVATIDENGAITLVGAGQTTIKAAFAGNDSYNAGDASYMLVVKEKEVAGSDKFELVTDATSLTDGDVIILVGTNINEDGDVVASYALSTTQNSNNRAANEVTIDEDGTITPGSSIQQITLEEGFCFNVGDGYLYAASSSSNWLRTEATADDNAKASISISESGDATIVFQGENTRNHLRFNLNNGNPIFSCYAEDSKQILPQIYRKVTSTETKLGDVNNDGDVDVADVTALVNALKKGEEPEAGNIDGQNGVNAEDVRALVEMILSNSNQ